MNADVVFEVESERAVRRGAPDGAVDVDGDGVCVGVDFDVYLK